MKSLQIRFAESNDSKSVRDFDPHSKFIDPLRIKNKIEQKEVIIALLEKKIIGIIKFSYFWDTRPYMDLIYVEEKYRKQNIGRQLLNFLEDYLKKNGCTYLYTSSEEPEKEPQAWHKKMGFQECGVLDKINLPHNKNKEVFFFKRIASGLETEEKLQTYPIY